MSRGAALLVGGRATRMGGVVKALVSVGGKPILDRQLEVLRPRTSELFLCTSRPEPFAGYGLRCVPDLGVAPGPLGAVIAGLETARCTELWIVAGDMPLLSAATMAVFERCADENPDAEIVASSVAGVTQPLHAIYRVRAAGRLRARAAEGVRSLRRIIDESGVGVAWVEESELRSVDPALDFLRNVNEPAETELQDALK